MDLQPIRWGPVTRPVEVAPSSLGRLVREARERLLYSRDGWVEEEAVSC